ncbi:hypothetical protein FRC14_000054 [Serendipita sp. 396]|nr:hypothetical protein FRC14_000054 [Serendipita sp. 396]KAG8789865.1 hypothetical protein FRC15_000057 [Serendipita sp. 397]KAG8804794.1 hypothetical protein FRC16_000048 [Serendipita sp. 398]KAG8825060.1 hypothetical protein FRC19_000497 [Serendipita sp. 401]KAG8830357.1 hypothetical protein FRC18_008244 [Serendipita sp. 400]KAG8860378.1 hypothetical protein FRB91_003791 [Serendipita sp. 411]KAG8879463.1 hypothetical protein FRC20_000035 [Serendipita sp. 405]KAG9057423.1 hypothetical prot
MLITHLPVEIVLEIIQLVFNKPDDNFVTSLEWARSGDKWRNWWDRKRDDRMESDSSANYGSLLALSQTNCYFRKLCTPFIYSRIDLVEAKDYTIAMKNKEFIQSLRITLSINYQGIDSGQTRGQIFSVLKACTHITALVVNYECSYVGEDMELPTSSPPISTTIASMLKSGQLKTLALSATGMGIQGAAGEEATIGPLSLLWKIKEQAMALDNDQKIHLAAYRSAMPKHSVDQEASYDRYYEVPRDLLPYFPPSNLISLQLMGSGGVHSPYIPDLVLHCPQLEYLFVSECGDDIGLPPVTRDRGWSEHKDALWRRRQPLKELHAEHMLAWEMIAMGTIPARTVILTSLVQDDMQNSFLRDPEIFPCMEHLHYESVDDMPSGGEDIRNRFQEVLKRREVRWRADATYRYGRRGLWFRR